MRFIPGERAKERHTLRMRRWREKARKQAALESNASTESTLEAAVSEEVGVYPSLAEQPKYVGNASTRTAFPWKCPWCDKIVPNKGYEQSLRRAEWHLGHAHPV